MPSSFSVRRQLPLEEPGRLRRHRALLRALRETVHVLAGDVVALRDVLGGEPHRDVDVRDCALTDELGVQLLRVLRVAVDLGDRLDPGRDVDVALARLDRVEGHPRGLQGGRTEAVDRRSRNALGEAGQERGAAGEVHALLLLREPAADHHVDDLVRIEPFHLPDRLLDREREQVVRADVQQRPLGGTPDRGADGADDDGFGHSSSLRYVKALSPVRALPTISVWIWLVPSYSVVTRASRRYFATGYSST